MRPSQVAVALAGAAAMLAAAVVPVSAAPGEQVDVVVVLAEDTAPGAQGRAVARDHGVALRHQYVHALPGLAGSMPAARVAQLERDPRVASVEPDARVEAASVPTGIERIGALDNPMLPIADTAEATGRVDATVAIIDSGIDLTHPQLDVVHEWGCHTVSSGPRSQRGTFCESGQGHGDAVGSHGTHVAGTVAATAGGVVGVAPGARLWSVRVLGANGGSVSDVIAGVDHVTRHATEIDVANVSLGGEFTSQALDSAIATSVAAGVTYVLAAGNTSMDVAGYSPAGHPDALTVAALADYDGVPGSLGSPTCGDAGRDDTLATFSNYGAGVDLLAPGVCIRSTVPGGTGLMSGTSMAAPHVAGAAALLASAGVQTPADIHAAILAAGSSGWVTASWPGSGSRPLLDVADPTVFAPTLISGEEPEDTGPTEPGTDEPGNDEPGADEPAVDGVQVVGGWSSARGQWTSWVDITVIDGGAPASGSIVSVEWSADGSTPATGERCTTDAEGTCRVVGPTLPNRDKAVTYTVTHLDGVAIGPVSLTVTRD